MITPVNCALVQPKTVLTVRLCSTAHSRAPSASAFSATTIMGLARSVSDVFRSVAPVLMDWSVRNVGEATASSHPRTVLVSVNLLSQKVDLGERSIRGEKDNFFFFSRPPNILFLYLTFDTIDGFQDDGINSDCSRCSARCLTCEDGKPAECLSCDPGDNRDQNPPACSCGAGFYEVSG